jgi:hypothetical protein
VHLWKLSVWTVGVDTCAKVCIMGKILQEVLWKNKCLCQQCHVEHYTEWWGMLNHVLVAGQNMKSGTCDFLRWGMVYIDRNVHRQYSSYRCYKSLSPVPRFPLHDLNVRNWPAVTSLWGLYFQKKQIPTVTLNWSFHYYSVNWQKGKCRTSHFFLHELKDFFQGEVINIWRQELHCVPVDICIVRPVLHSEISRTLRLFCEMK